jgi:hypothetical protein
VASETCFSKAVVGDQCFTFQGGYQHPLPSFYLAFSVRIKSAGAALSNSHSLSNSGYTPPLDSMGINLYNIKSAEETLSGSHRLSKSGYTPLLDSTGTRLYNIKSVRAALSGSHCLSNSSYTPLLDGMDTSLYNIKKC